MNFYHLQSYSSLNQSQYALQDDTQYNVFDDSYNINLMHPQKRQRDQKSIFQRPLSNSKLRTIKSQSQLQLPIIYSKSLKVKIQQVSLERQNQLRKQLCKVNGFRDTELTSKISQQVKAISNSSQAYSVILEQIITMFKSCDIDLKERDVLIVEGKRSQAKYIFITSCHYSPHSVCCNESVIIKCIDSEAIEESNTKSKTINRYHMICTCCGKIILKLIEKDSSSQSKYEKKKRLLDFALHIASGRYKKHRLENESSLAPDHLQRRIFNSRYRP